MAKENFDGKKEAYRLWIEYLRRSEDYKEFCRWEKVQRENLPIKIPIPQKYTEDEKGKDLYRRMTHIFRKFGNIHRVGFSFTEWWKYYKKRYKWQEPPIIAINYADKIDNDFNWGIAFTKEIYGHFHDGEPTIEEYKKEFLKIIKRKSSPLLYLMVDLSFSLKEINDSVNKIVKEQKKDREINKRKRFGLSTNYLRLEELERHLTVYCLRKRKDRVKVDEIIKSNKFYQRLGTTLLSARRLVFMDVKKAERIINNIENGIFPGKYDKSESKN